MPTVETVSSVFLNEQCAFDGLLDYGQSLIFKALDLLSQEFGVFHEGIYIDHCLDELAEFIVSVLLFFYGLLSPGQQP
jgi:hypothetical protein